MADSQGLGGVQAFTNIPLARMRVNVPQSTVGLVEGFKEIEALFEKFAVDDWEATSAELENKMLSELNRMEFQSELPENATNATKLYNESVSNMIASTDWADLPPAYQTSITNTIKSHQRSGFDRLMRKQNDALEARKGSVSDGNYAITESDILRVTNQPGASLGDVMEKSTEIIGRFTLSNLRLTGGLGTTESIDKTSERAIELKLSAIQSYGKQNAQGALEWLDTGLKSGVILGSQDTEDLRADLMKSMPGQNGTAMANAASAQFPLYVKGRFSTQNARARREFAARVPENARKEFETANGRTEKMEKQIFEAEQLEGRDRVVSMLYATGALRKKENLKRADDKDNPFVDAMDPSSAVEVAGIGPDGASVKGLRSLSQDILDLKELFRESGGTDAEFDKLVDTLVIEGGDLISDPVIRAALFNMSGEQLVDADLRNYRTHLSVADHDDLLLKQNQDRNKNYLTPASTATLEQIATRRYGSNNESKGNFKGKVWSAVNAARTELGGKGMVSNDEFLAVVSQVEQQELIRAAEVTKILADVHENGSALQQHLLEQIEGVLISRAGTGVQPSPDAVLARYNAAMAGLFDRMESDPSKEIPVMEPEPRAFEFSRVEVTDALEAAGIDPTGPDPRLAEKLRLNKIASNYIASLIQGQGMPRTQAKFKKIERILKAVPDNAAAQKSLSIMYERRPQWAPSPSR